MNFSIANISRIPVIFSLRIAIFGVGRGTHSLGVGYFKKFNKCCLSVESAYMWYYDGGQYNVYGLKTSFLFEKIKPKV